MITANDLRNTAQIHDNSTQAHFLKFVTSEATPSIEDLHFRNCLTFECNSSFFFFVLGCMILHSLNTIIRGMYLIHIAAVNRTYLLKMVNVCC